MFLFFFLYTSFFSVSSTFPLFTLRTTPSQIPPSPGSLDLLLDFVPLQPNLLIRSSFRLCTFLHFFCTFCTFLYPLYPLYVYIFVHFFFVHNSYFISYSILHTPYSNFGSSVHIIHTFVRCEMRTIFLFISFSFYPLFPTSTFPLLKPPVCFCFFPVLSYVFYFVLVFVSLSLSLSLSLVFLCMCSF